MVNFISKTNNKPKPTIPGIYRCNVCNKKVLSISIAIIGLCKCKKLYCYKHKFTEKHNCTFDYKSEQIEKLKKILPVIVADKVPIEYNLI